MISNEKVQILIRSTLNALSFAGAVMFGLGERIVRFSTGSCRCCSCWPVVAPLRGTGFCHGLALLRRHHMPPQQHRALLPLA